MFCVQKRAVLAACICAAASAPLLGQDMVSPSPRSDDQTPASEAVVVTAEKLPQDPQRIPVSLDVLSGQQIGDAVQLNDFARLGEYLPNVRYTDTGGRATFGYLQIRGLINSSQAVDPSAAVYVDGVPVGDFYSCSQRLYDVDRIEVLRGPQRTH